MEHAFMGSCSDFACRAHWLSAFTVSEQRKMLYENTCRIYDLGE